MTDSGTYIPGPASGARIQKDGEHWTLVLVRDLRHSPAKVWEALTEPSQLTGWAPFDADNSLGVAGNAVKLTTVGAPTPHVTNTVVSQAVASKTLVYTWGENFMRWELEPVEGGTRMTLYTTIDRRYIAMGAAGWHLCFDVLDRLLTGHPIGRMVGMDVMKFDGWQRLHAEYAQQFGIEPPTWS